MQQPQANLRVAFASIACGCCLALGGCSGNPNVKVGGEVKLNGVPLESGTIHFEPADGTGPTAEAVISAGRYEIAMLPGPKKVSVQSYKVIGKVPIGGPGGPLTDKTVQLIPDRYSEPAKTELNRDIPSSAGDVDFELSVAVGPSH